jgi:hypothetical protein
MEPINYVIEEITAATFPAFRWHARRGFVREDAKNELMTVS